MTASFHKFGEYFPGTGDVKDKVYSVDVISHLINVIRDMGRVKITLLTFHFTMEWMMRVSGALFN
jgi:hypothetical protein